VSCHDADELRLAFARGASYALLSPVFPPTSKPTDTRETLGTRRFRDLAADHPVYALGGITADTAFPCFGVAVLGWLFTGTPAEAALRSEALRVALQKANSVSS
jgi:thiamine monophosphate synthase